MPTAQEQAQALAASTTNANNGNPNTVYNTPQGAWGATGGWNTTTVTPAANFQPVNVQPVGWTAPNAGPQMQPLAVLPDGWSTPTQPFVNTPPVTPPGGGGTVPPITQPPVNNPKPPVNGGGNKPPTNKPNTNVGGSGLISGVNGGNFWTDGGGTKVPGTNTRGNSFGDGASGTIDLGAFGKWLDNTAPGTAGKLGFNEDGSIDLAQVADWFIPGNAYNNGEWNVGNAVISALAKFTGLPLTSLSKIIGNTSWVQKGNSALARAIRDWDWKNDAMRARDNNAVNDPRGQWGNFAPNVPAGDSGGWVGPSPGDGNLSETEYMNWINDLGKGLNSVSGSGGMNNNTSYGGTQGVGTSSGSGWSSISGDAARNAFVGLASMFNGGDGENPLIKRTQAQ